MDADRLAPHVRRVVDAAGDVDERLLVLLFFRKAEPAPDLAEMLGVERAEATAALGRLSQAGLVAHQRPEGEPIHWFATSAGKARAEQLHRAAAARAAGTAAEAEPSVPSLQPPDAAVPDVGRVKARRKVSIDQSERGGFSWD